MKNYPKASQLRFTLLILFSLVGATFNHSYAQKTKKEQVYNNNLFKDYLDVIHHYDENDNVISKQMLLYGQDLRYQHITELVSVYSGSPQELMNYMNAVEKFVNENEPDVSTTLEGYRITVVKQMGRKGFSLYEKDGLGYRSYNMKSWGKIKKALVKWAKKNNEEIEG